MSCSDILLSFLSDVGEDWTDSFIFPDTELSTINVDDYLNKSDYAVETTACATASVSAYPSAPFTPTSAAACASPNTTIHIDQSCSADDKEFNDALDLFDFGDDEFSTGISTDEMFAACASTPHTASLEAILSTPQQVSGKRSFSESTTSSECSTDSSSAVSNSDNNMPPKKTKISVNEQISSVCGLLRKYRVHKTKEDAKAKLLAQRRFRYANPIGTAESYLQALFNATPTSPQDLLKLSSSTATFSCKALSSLVAQSQSKKAMKKLSAWMPVNSQSAKEFPESHSGIGQIAAASRAFVSGMGDIVSQSLMGKMKFNVSIQRDSAITSRFGDRLSAPFVWKSEGLMAMGYPEELEFNGLIRCTFVKEGVATANVSFDACKIIRQQAMLGQSNIMTANTIV